MGGIYSAIAIKCIYTHSLPLYIIVCIISGRVANSCSGLKLRAEIQRKERIHELDEIWKTRADACTHCT